jgi:nicotinamide-nucleotide amidase
VSDLKALMTHGTRLKLAVAESLTCGRLQARIGTISGASEFFLGGVTAYALEQKVGLLGVDRAEAVASNCVSARVAEQMARGACVLFGADIGVATTGYAEISPEQGVDTPFAWWAVARRQVPDDFSVTSGTAAFPGLSRVEVQERVAQLAYEALEGSLRETAAARRP